MNLKDKINEAYDYITNKVDKKPEIVLILGSGLGSLADSLENKITIDFKDIPNFPTSNVVGHNSQLVFGNLEGKEVVVLKGRVHFYEGYSMQEITIPLRVINKMGTQKLIVTNSCGAVNTSFKAGTLMVINDHINLMGTSPLIGDNLEEFGTRFPDMTHTYNKKHIDSIMKLQNLIDTPIEQGVYCGWMGPAYETPAEIRMIRTLGADAVGMSTVPEVIIAAHQEMDVIGISTLTNAAAGVTGNKLNHEEVIEVANRVKSDFEIIVRKVVKDII